MSTHPSIYTLEESTYMNILPIHLFLDAILRVITLTNNHFIYSL